MGLGREPLALGDRAVRDPPSLGMSFLEDERCLASRLVAQLVS